MQCSSTSPALLNPLEELIALHPSTPVVGLIPPSLTNSNDIITLGKDQSSQFFLFVPHTVCVDIKAFQMYLLPFALPPSDGNITSLGLI